MKSIDIATLVNVLRIKESDLHLFPEGIQFRTYKTDAGRMLSIVDVDGSEKLYRMKFNCTTKKMDLIPPKGTEV